MKKTTTFKPRKLYYTWQVLTTLRVMLKILVVKKASSVSIAIINVTLVQNFCSCSSLAIDSGNVYRDKGTEEGRQCNQNMERNKVT